MGCVSNIQFCPSGREVPWGRVWAEVLGSSAEAALFREAGGSECCVQGLAFCTLNPISCCRADGAD